MTYKSYQLTIGVSRVTNYVLVYGIMKKNHLEARRVHFKDENWGIVKLLAFQCNVILTSERHSPDHFPLS